MLTSNLCVQWGLFNGAIGRIVDIYFQPSRKPHRDGKAHPDVVFVEFPSYCGEEIVPGHPKLVPVGQLEWKEHCSHGCFRKQIPLRMCWAITSHKSQGMTVSEKHPVKYVVVDLGEDKTEKWASGAAFVMLSRSTEIGRIAIEGNVNAKRFTSVSQGKREIAFEDERLYALYQATQRRNVVEFAHDRFDEVIDILNNWDDR